MSGLIKSGDSVVCEDTAKRMDQNGSNRPDADHNKDYSVSNTGTVVGNINESILEHAAGNLESLCGNPGNKATADGVNSENTENIEDVKIKVDRGVLKESIKIDLLENNADETDALIEDDKKQESVVETDTVKAPDGGWGWIIVIGVVFLRTVIGGFVRSHGLFYLRFKEKFDGSATKTALVTSLSGFVRMGTGPMVSLLTARVSCRMLSAFGGIAMFISIIMTTFAPSLGFLYFSYGIASGLARSFATTPCPILLGYYFDKRRSLAFGIASAGFSIGGFAITPMVELLFQEYGYQGAFLILSAFSLNVLVSSGLFRSIEVHRKIMAIRVKKYSAIDQEGCKIDETNEVTKVTSNSPSSDQDMYSSTASMTNSETHNQKQNHIPNHKQRKANSNYTQHAPTTDRNKETGDGCDARDALLTKETEGGLNEEQSNTKTETKKEQNPGPQLLCCKRNTSTETKSPKKKKIMSWSVVKDVRFMCFVMANFCLSLQAKAVFLPALAKSKGCSDIQAATLISVTAGCDTVFRVVSGIVLDLKPFRKIRPQIYNALTFLQAGVLLMFTFLGQFHEFVLLCILDGALSGAKMAQGSVVVMDMLGVDKLASSMAVTMAIQCIAVLIGPTISGQLIDTYGSYDKAFYFGSAATFLGGVIMAGGHVFFQMKYKRQQSRDDKKDDPESSK